MGVRGQRTGSKAMGGATASIPNYKFYTSSFGGSSEKHIQILGFNLDISLIEEDTRHIKINTPVITGRLISSYSIIDGDITNRAPYVFLVEARRHFIRDSIDMIARDLVERLKRQVSNQKLYNIPVPLGTIIIGV